MEEGRQIYPATSKKRRGNPCGAGPAAPELAWGKGDRCLQLLWLFGAGQLLGLLRPDRELAGSSNALGKVRAWYKSAGGYPFVPFLPPGLRWWADPIPGPRGVTGRDFVGNVAQDFLLDTESLAARRLQVAGEVNQRHFRVDLDSYALLIKNPIDREALCGLSASCIVPLSL